MEYGLIGERLPHSFSREIHSMISDYDYRLCEISRDGLDAFMKQRDFRAINVTIPYKESVIAYLDEIDPDASRCGAVNTVINRGGRLIGYNTDIYGMGALADRIGISFEDKLVLILGTGGTSKTAAALAASRGAAKVVRVGRTGRDDSVTYEYAYEHFSAADVIINTTPCGMFPNVDLSPIALDRFGSLSGVIDAVYNPLRTVLISEAESRGIPAEGGLYMLVSQALRASELFLDKKYDDSLCDRIFNDIQRSKENIVLIGMPGAGKTTIGTLIASRLGRPLIDTDEMIVDREGMSIPEIFKNHGEEYFRDAESRATAEAAALTGAVISTGGGVPLRDENIKRLKRSGRIIYIDRPLSMLLPTADRPLSSDYEALRRRYEERRGIYESCADARIENALSAEDAAQKTEEAFFGLTEIG